jgi:hypothetical protein
VKKQNSGMLTKLLYKVLANQEISMECFISSKFCKERTHDDVFDLIRRQDLVSASILTLSEGVALKRSQIIWCGWDTKQKKVVL